MSQNQRPENDAQVKLLIPSTWVNELDTIANVKLKSRLALLRQYIREQIDLDMIRLDEHFQKLDQIKRGKQSTDRWLQDRDERHSREDEW